MYAAMILVLLATAGLLVYRGTRAGRRGLVLAGIGLVLSAALFFSLLGFWGEMLWFESLGYGERFWRFVLARSGAAAAGAVLGAAVVSSLLPFRAAGRRLPAGAGLLGAFVGGMWGVSTWETILLFLNRAEAGIAEPIFGLDAGFYLFVLPFLQGLRGLLLLLLLIPLAVNVFLILTAPALAGVVGPMWERLPSGVAVLPRRHGRLAQGAGAPWARLRLSVGLLFLVMGLGFYLDRFELLRDRGGVVAGPGWTDVHVRLPAYWALAVLAGLLGLSLQLSPVRRRAERLLAGRVEPEALGFAGPVLAGTVLAAAWLAGLQVLPLAFQRLRVEPNEITLERPYIEHSIRLTRHAFALDRTETRDFPYGDRLTPAMAEANGQILDNVRLWDPRVLDAVYRQFQEFRLYYEFADVDVGRYRLEDGYRQVMVSAREMEQANLPAQSQTFVNRVFKYTHGYGATMARVHEFTPDGLPVLLVRDIPPASSEPGLALAEPRIYHGELTRGYVVANSAEPEFDYPSGQDNAYAFYAGRGGVELGSLWRRFVYGWTLGGTRLLLSGYPGPGSRIMFHRQIEDRARTLAPFLVFDRDPYVVLAKGRLFWIIDAYARSDRFPYSEPFSGRETFVDGARRPVSDASTAGLAGANYVRNSVKVVIDAYDGTTDFYVFEPEDPLVKAWRGVAPGLFKEAERMDPELLAHIRYPVGMLLTQGLVYAKYHMTDPVVFYNQEDLWVRATEKYLGEVRAVDPYYVMWRPPDSDRLEFVLMLPFTPRNRQVLIGWMAGMCDPGSYGRLLGYKFPKDRLVIGPQQVETKIDQERFLAGQLTLWDQRGSRVLRGNMLAIPVADTLLYVEPIYLQAETAAYPELRLVALMHGERLSYAETFEEALRKLLGPAEPGSPAVEPTVQAPEAEEAAPNLAARASQAFESYLRLQGEGRFREAAESLEELRGLLQSMAGRKAP